MKRVEAWVAFAALAVTIVATVVGATWYLASTSATKEDISEIRQEIQQNRNRSETQMQELRGYIVDHLDGHGNN